MGFLPPAVEYLGVLGTGWCRGLTAETGKRLPEMSSASSVKWAVYAC